MKKYEITGFKHSILKPDLNKVKQSDKYTTKMPKTFFY